MMVRSEVLDQYSGGLEAIEEGFLKELRQIAGDFEVSFLARVARTCVDIVTLVLIGLMLYFLIKSVIASPSMM